jgi:OmpA-OmpF porin, OOP family
MVQASNALIALIAAAALAAPGVATAQMQPQSGLYIGGSIGQMEADGDCRPGRTCDFKDSAWKLFGGYQLNRHFAVEATYGDWGDITIRTTTASGIPVSATGEIWSAGVAALGILPLGGDRFGLFGKVGILYTEQEATGSAPGIPTETETQTGSELHYGVGALFNITRNLGVRAEWERLHDSELDILSIGIQFRF